MATLVIGSNGLIGTKLTHALAAQGEQVVCFSGHRPEQPVKGCTYIQGDVTEYGTINMIFKNHKIDRVIHNAAVSHPKLFVENPYKIYRINVLGTMTALEACRNYGVERFIYMSSGAVYGNVSMQVVTEDVKLHADNPYGATKVACEELVRNYGLDSVSLRIGFVYGPGRKFECPIHMLLSDLIRNGEVDWEHGMDQRLDYIYVDDCVDAVMTIALADRLMHREYNVGGGEVVPYTRIVQKARELFPNAPIQIGPGDLGYDNLGALSVERAWKDYGWRPKYTIESGMEQYARWLMEDLS